MKENKLRKFLKDGEPSLGTRILNQWPMIAELFGNSHNFDYIEYVAGYSPFDQYDLRTFPELAN